MKYFVWVAIILVAAAIIGAFFIIGSPLQQRMLRMDEQRLSDLQNIQYQASRHYEVRGRLPTTLAEMVGFEDFIVSVDPETGADYEYSVRSAKEFRLCANFALPSEEVTSKSVVGIPYLTNPYYPGGSENWKHPAGRGCFDLFLEIPGPDQEYPTSVTVKPASA